MSNYERIPARHQHLRVGCAAKAKSLVVVTHNRKHFEHIEGLEIEDWA
jgi:predicted nucleic acid-binding protein